MTKLLRVLIIDDVDEMRMLIAEVLNTIPSLKLSGQAANTAEARLELERRKPDLILLDEVLPGESSLDFLAEILVEGISVILVTSLEQLPTTLPGGVLGRLKKPHWKNTSIFEQDLLRTIALR